MVGSTSGTASSLKLLKLVPVLDGRATVGDVAADMLFRDGQVRFGRRVSI